MTDNKQSSKFINIYNELSEYMEKQLHEKSYRSHVEMLNIMSRKNHIIKSHYNELRTFANLRNIIVHDSTNSYNPIAEPHPSVIKRYEYILNKLINPPTAYSISTKAHNMFFAHPGMKVMDCIVKMHEQDYTYLPVCTDNKLIGVLSGDSIFTYMRKNSTIEIDKEFTVADLGDSIIHPIDERYAFVSKNTPLAAIVRMYTEEIEDGKRLGAVFVTHSGNSKEKILGIISSWDLIDYMRKDK